MTASHVNPEKIGYQLTNYLGGALSFVPSNKSSHCIIEARRMLPDVYTYNHAVYYNRLSRVVVCQLLSLGYTLQKRLNGLLFVVETIADLRYIA